MRGWAGLIAVLLSGCGDLAAGVLNPDAAVDAGLYRCSPMTCAGCCSNNICRSGLDQLACGYGGRACRECLAGTSCVAPGTCLGDPVDGGAKQFDPDDAGVPTNPFTGAPMPPQNQECFFIFGRYYCS